MPAEATHVSDPVADPALLTHWLVLGRVTLPGDPRHVRSARTFVARTMGADHPRADEALLLTSELVTNAVTHSRSRLPGGMVKVVVATKASSLLISVTDDGSDSTEPAITGIAGGEHGNGLLLTESIADLWGYLRNPQRTMVWFKLCAGGSRGSPLWRSLADDGQAAPGRRAGRQGKGDPASRQPYPDGQTRAGGAAVAELAELVVSPGAGRTGLSRGARRAVRGLTRRPASPATASTGARACPGSRTPRGACAR